MSINNTVTISNKKALIIAISNYDQGFEHLDFCKNDGQEMVKTLKNLGYHIPSNYDKIGNISSLELRDTIFDFFDNDKNKSSDTLIFYYSGHSIPDSQGDVYFASSDTHPNFPFKKGFNFSDLTKVINSCSASIVAILDCCYSGAAELHKGNEDDMALVGTSQIDKMSQVVNENEGKYILCAGQKYEKAYKAKKANHSVYSYYLLNGLKGNKNAVDNNGNVTPESLDKYIVQEFRKLPPNEKPLQKPVRKVEASGEIVLAGYPHLRKKELKNDGSLVSEGIQYFENEDNDAALKLFDQAIEINPKNVRGYNYKGHIFFRLQKYEEAIKWYDEALKINPQYVDVLKYKGLSFEKLEKYEQALDCFEKALEINPKIPENWYHNGLILKRAERFNDAINCFDKVLELRPDDIEILIAKGKIFEILKKYDKAIECYTKVIFIDPYNVDAKNNINILASISTRTETYKAVAMWGSKGSGDGQFESPRGMAVNHGEVYVVDSINNRIQKFDNNGRFVIKWGPSSRLSKVKNLAIFTTDIAAAMIGVPGVASRGIVTFLFNRKKSPKPYKFYYLSGIAMDSDNVNIYVTDSNNHRIQKFDNNGRFIIEWGSEGNGDGQFNTPSGIAVDSSGNVYVADSKNYRIQKFDSHDMFIRKWGSHGSGDGKFKYPIGIAVNSSGNVYVADIENHRIQKFDSHGKFVTEWGSIGSEDGQFSMPSDIAVDSNGYVYVVDRANHRIQKFDSDGKFVTKWSYTSTENNESFCPELISVDNNGNVYTYNSSSNQIVKFSLQQ